jgi:hypothetical protein
MLIILASFGIVAVNRSVFLLELGEMWTHCSINVNITERNECQLVLLMECCSLKSNEAGPASGHSLIYS